MYARRSFAFTVIVLAIVASLAYYVAPRVGPSSRAPAYEEKLKASETMLAAEQLILEANKERATQSELTDDPTIAAMLGLPTSQLTTDAGSLRAKITSTNPNFAALIVDFLDQAGVRRGDVVAVSYTGSFPALDIAAISAAEAMGAEPLIVSSVGSSTWGANDPEFTILDIESLLNSDGIIHHNSLAASVGGDFRVHPLSPDGRKLAQQAMDRNRVTSLHPLGLQESVQQRLDIYDKAAGERQIKAFLNVGGGLASVGSGQDAVTFDPGLTIGPDRGDVEAEGLIYYMGQRGVPVVNLTDIVSLAKHYRFAVNPAEMPPIGEGTPWRNWTSLRIRAGIAAAFILALAMGLRLLVLSPTGQRQFDAYFGLAPYRIASLVRKLLPGRPEHPLPPHRD